MVIHETGVRSSAVPPTLLGGRYRLGAVIGYGGTAVLHRGIDPQTAATVAVKLSRGDIHDDTIQDRFHAEAQAMAVLDHPCVVRLHDAGHENNRAYLVMELVDGPTLAARLTPSPSPAADTAPIARDLAAALAHAHAHGLVHPVTSHPATSCSTPTAGHASPTSASQCSPTGWSTGRGRCSMVRRCGGKMSELTGPSPVDRGKPGSKIHALSDRAGLPLAVEVSAANTNDAAALKPLVLAIPRSDPDAADGAASPTSPTRTRPTTTPNCAPGSVAAASPSALTARSSSPARSWAGIARSSNCSIAWLLGYRRLTIRYERKASHFGAFLTLAAALTCYKNPPRETCSKPK